MKQADIESLVSQSIARALAFQHAAAPAATAPATQFLTTPSKAVGGGNGKVKQTSSNRAYEIEPGDSHDVPGLWIHKIIDGKRTTKKFNTDAEAAAVAAFLK